MLGKLLKHEWRSTWKLPTALNIFTVVMTLLGALSFNMPMWDKLVNSNAEFLTFWDFSAIAILVTYFVAIVIIAYAVMIYFAIRFYRNLYTDQGYLMHTLPTTPANLILSKGIIAGSWTVFTNILVSVSMFFLLYVFMITMIPASELQEVSKAFSDILPQIDAIFMEYGGTTMAGSVFVFFLIMLVSGFSGMVIIYLCICIGQLFKKHKVAASIITYFVATSVIQTISSIAILPITFGMMSDMETLIKIANDPLAAIFAPYASMMPIYYVSLAVSVVEVVIFFFVCNYITKRKLNLD